MTPFLWGSISGNAWRAEIELRFPRENFQVRLRDVGSAPRCEECSPMPGVLPDAEYIGAFSYIHIVSRKPAKMKKLKEIKPVVHCDINVPSRWQTFHHLSRRISVFTNGKLLLPPVRVIIPRPRLAEWESVLATINEKVFPLGGVRRLFTMNGHLLDNAKDLQDQHFYVAAGLEAFKSLPYWECPGVDPGAQQKSTDTEKNSQKKKEDAKGGKPHEHGRVPLKAQESVFYAKKRKKKRPAKPLVHSRAEGDVYKAQSPHLETQGASEVLEEQDEQVQVPVDQWVFAARRGIALPVGCLSVEIESRKWQ
ncbi:doublecortin domain-containing protein 2C [Pteropus alecto]|uniref:doublecortin domain-containing protein 2C n=1 Tax=Pteropus alecto TaxID=9402 RepID=UPI0007688ACA|nr:doublecortin domain-containing protein 2C [Pteropus alecto]